MRRQSSCKSQHTMYSPDAIASDCRDLIALAAGPRDWNDTRESWLSRAARRIGIGYSRAYNIFYGRSKRIEASEYLSIIRAVHQMEKQNAERNALTAEISGALARLDSKPSR